MNLLQDVITYVRRIIKSPSDAVVTDDLIIDYINRFWIMDLSARMQHFDLKTKYQFMTRPGVDKYNMPLYSLQTQPGNQPIAMFPVYQGFIDPVLVNGVPVKLQTQKNSFFNYWFQVTQNIQATVQGNNSTGPYRIQMPILPSSNPPIQPPFNPPLAAILRGHIDIQGIISTGNNIDPPVVSSIQAINNPGIPGTISRMLTTSVDSAVFITSMDSTGSPVVVADSGQFLDGYVNYGLLMQPGPAPYGNLPLGGYDINTNTINYFTGIANVTFPVAIPTGTNINATCYFFTTGLPRAVLFYNNVLTFRSPPDRQYLVELDAYLSPVAFLTTEAAIPFAYMAEYIARGAARKILSDTGDVEQFMFYEPLFREQELLVWKRSQRIWTANRTETIYSQGHGFGNGGGGNNYNGGGL